MTAKRRIVFCDDDADLLEALGDVAREMGMDVHLASGPVDLLARIEEIRPDVIVSDINMPDMNGFELVTRLKTKGSSIPFIFLTGDPSMQNYQRGFVEGHFDFLSKPIDFLSLESAIRKALTFGVQHAPAGRVAELIEIAHAVKPTGTSF